MHNTLLLLQATDFPALHRSRLATLQVNLGYRCNQSCLHCHVNAGPGRSEMMDDPNVELIPRVLAARGLTVLDLTGGAPELHPRVRELAAAFVEAGLRVQVRTNLTVLLEPECQDLPALWARLGVGLLASLPSTDPADTDRQRGARTFARSLEVLRQLNRLGYGTGGALRLDLASNRDGAQPGACQAQVERRFRTELGERHGVRFDALHLIVNVPLGRFGHHLAAQDGGRDAYLERLEAAFNPATVARLACRRSLAVAWDGRLYDCDFNLGAGLPIRGGRSTVFDWADEVLLRPIALGPHCYACTADEGSS
jgi:radical SAM/Cys-rich protein